MADVGASQFQKSEVRSPRFACRCKTASSNSQFRYGWTAPGVSPSPRYLVSVGSTGYQPVPSGNLPDGTGTALERQERFSLWSDAFPIPPGRLPGGAGKLPAPPTLTLMAGVAQLAASKARLARVQRKRALPFAA